MKRKISILFAVLLAVSLSVSVYAQSGTVTGTVTFDGKKLSSSYTAADFTAPANALQPGDDLTYTITLTNNHKEETEWWMYNRVIESFEAHSAADVDMRVSKKAKFADASVDPDRVANLPFAIQICKRMGQVQTENAIFAFLIKALLIFLAINGKCTIWFAAFLDMAATLATVLNAIRVTQDSLLSKLRRSE